MAQLNETQFYEQCKILKITNQRSNDPDKKAIEKAFRRLALKTHPDKVTLLLGIIKGKLECIERKPDAYLKI